VIGTSANGKASKEGDAILLEKSPQKTIIMGNGYFYILKHWFFGSFT